MSELPPSPDSQPPPDDVIVKGDDAASVGMPRWVKGFLIVGLALVLLLAVGKVTGLGGEHGPGRHGGGSDAPSSVHDGGNHQPPAVQYP